MGASLRLLVTGAGGFLGQHLLNALIEENSFAHLLAIYSPRSIIKPDIFRPKVTQLRCDLTGEANTRELVFDYKPTVVYHLAGNPAVRDESASLVKTNVLSTQHLLSACPKGTKFLLASSATVYGNFPYPAHEHIKFSEDFDRPNPASVYAASKLAAEALVEAYTRLGQVRGSSLRLVANVGRGATHGVLPDLLRKLHSGDEVLEILGDSPGSTKPYIHVVDAVKAFLTIGQLEDPPLRVNVAPDDEITIAQLAKIIMKTIGLQKEVFWRGEASNWRGDNKAVRLQNTRLLRLGWTPTYLKSADAVKAAVRELSEGNS